MVPLNRLIFKEQNSAVLEDQNSLKLWELVVPDEDPHLIGVCDIDLLE